MQTKITMTRDEAERLLTEGFRNEMQSLDNADIVVTIDDLAAPRPVNKIAAIKALREIIAFDNFIEDRPIKTDCVHGVFRESAGTRSGRYIALTNAKAVVERLMVALGV